MRLITPETHALPAGIWTVDKVHSHVGFAVDYMAGTFVGSFAEVDATLSDGVLKGSVSVGDVLFHDAHLEAHLQAADFFDADRHPDLTFESNSISVGLDQVAIDGEITIKGHTEPVAVTGRFTEPFLDAFGATRLGFELTATIDRTKFGVSWNNPLPNGQPALSHQVTILAQLQFVGQGCRTCTAGRRARYATSRCG
jgi:polyisoprenoid-binding protein YceI